MLTASRNRLWVWDRRALAVAAWCGAASAGCWAAPAPVSQLGPYVQAVAHSGVWLAHQSVNQSVSGLAAPPPRQLTLLPWAHWDIQYTYISDVYVYTQIGIDTYIDISTLRILYIAIGLWKIIRSGVRSSSLLCDSFRKINLFARVPREPLGSKSLFVFSHWLLLK